MAESRVGHGFIVTRPKPNRFRPGHGHRATALDAGRANTDPVLLRWTLAAEISDRMAWFLDQCKRASVDNLLTQLSTAAEEVRT